MNAQRIGGQHTLASQVLDGSAAVRLDGDPARAPGIGERPCAVADELALFLRLRQVDGDRKVLAPSERHDRLIQWRAHGVRRVW